jgi:hypothetical protein
VLSRQSQVRVEVSNTVAVSDSEISHVARLWEHYLNSNPDSNYLNPNWSESEQQKYHPYDLAAHTWWGVSLYAWLPGCKTSLLSVSRVGDSFVLRTMFYLSPPGDSGRVNVISIIQTGAHLENGSYKLCNALPINTRSWKSEQVGSIKFVCPLEHQFNRSIAVRMSTFIDSLAAIWKTALVPIEYYFADDIDRVAKALGFDYWPAEGSVAGPRGFVDSKNRIIYSGGSNEWYPHEFVHIYVNPLFPNAHSYFLEGYATLVGGSGGHDLKWHIKRNYEYLKNHPEVDVLTFRGVDQFRSAPYFIGGMLCKMAEEKGGLAGIQKLLTYGNHDADLYQAIRDSFGISKENINKFLMGKLAEYATN